MSYQLAVNVPEPAEIPQIFAIGPNGFEKRIPVSKSAGGSYRGRLHIGRLSGLFRIRPLQDSNVFPEIACIATRKNCAIADRNQATGQMSALTGGRFNPSPDSRFDARGRAMYVTRHLWPLLLGLAIALTIAELVARKWSGLAQMWRRG